MWAGLDLLIFIVGVCSRAELEGGAQEKEKVLDSVYSMYMHVLLSVSLFLPSSPSLPSSLSTLSLSLFLFPPLSLSLKGANDSEASSIQLEDDKDDLIHLSRSPSATEEDDESMDDEEQDEESGDQEDSDGEHADYCHICQDGGELLCCDKCPKAYHLQCLYPPLKKIPDGTWHCPRCTVGVVPEVGVVTGFSLRAGQGAPGSR